MCVCVCTCVHACVCVLILLCNHWAYPNGNLFFFHLSAHSSAIMSTNFTSTQFIISFLYLLYLLGHLNYVSFPDISVDKESACNVGDTSSIPGSGRSPGERINYPLQYSWSSLVTQLVKNSSAMWETWVRSLGWENPLEKRKATHSSSLAWRILWTV